MNTTRKNSGSTLAVAAACAMVIVVVGIFLYLTSRMIGGFRELKSASDSGALNVAKNIIASPLEPLTDAETANYKLLCETDANGNLLLDPTGHPQVDLRVYNRLVGQALLVGLNAQADGTALGIQNAKTLIDQLETAKTGVAARLGAKLGQKDSALGFFSSLWQWNSLRMFGQGSNANSLEGHYTISYMGRQPGDHGASNLLAPNALQIPTIPNTANMPSDSTAVGADKQLYLRGYLPINVAGDTLMGVVENPGEQPHLVGATAFSQQQQPPNGPGPIPNAFRSTGLGTEQVTSKMASADSDATIGALTSIYPPQIPGGYIVIHNAPGNPNSSMGNFNTVLNGDLGNGTGIDANYDAANKTYFFSASPGLLNSWAQHLANPLTEITVTKKEKVYNKVTKKFDTVDVQVQEWVKLCPKDGPQWQAGGSPTGTVSDLFRVAPNGSLTGVTGQQAHGHNYSGVKNCNDTNTYPDVWDGGLHVCDNLLPYFEQSYAPNPPFNGYQSPVPNPNAKNLTAVETMKADVEHLFNDCGYMQVQGNQGLTTGIRVYNCGIGANCPWPQWQTLPNNVGYFPGTGLSDYNPQKYTFPQISHNGNLSELIHQVTNNNNAAANNYVSQFQTFLSNRMAQISGKNAAQLAPDINQVMNTLLPIGPDQYIWYSKVNGNYNVQIGTALPPTFTGVATDGSSAITVSSDSYWPVKFRNNVMFTYVDSWNDHGVDKYPFQLADGKIGVKESIILTPSSGFNNNLGEIDLLETVTLTPGAGKYNKGIYFCEPN